MQTFFVREIVGSAAPLDAEDARHVLKALRLKPDEKVAIACEGRRYLARIRAEGMMAVAEILEELPSNEPRIHVTLYQGLPKGDKMDLIVQKCTELGICRVVPCQMSRCVTRWEGGDKKLSRWRRIAREAATQCGRALVPEIQDCLPFRDLPEALTHHQLALVPWESAVRPGALREALAGMEDIALVIGPEGGISPEEIQALRALPVTLGPRILRTETAGLAALTMLLTLSGEMP